MKLGFTLHSITHTAEKTKLAPGLVAEFSDKDHKDMLSLDAIREPTDEETELFRRANNTPDDKASADKARKALEKTAADKARKALEKTAAGLNVKFTKKLSDEKLQGLIDQAIADKAASDDLLG